MAGSTTKQAIVERFEKEPLSGYINPISFLQPAGIEMLSAQGNIVTLPYGDIKTISFVRDLQGAESAAESERRVFLTRPKMDGLWVRLAFRDGDVMEGVLPNNLLQLEHYGFTVIPPDSYGNRQRVFVPRAALRLVEVLGVVGSPLTKRKAKGAPKEQIGLFEEG
ncbi:MAG TPA: hypothetical protein VLW65_07065 [Bryobacteraceae bacterium]|nr:hypothetical protein [Bryobacteraceae bacterium]